MKGFVMGHHVHVRHGGSFALFCAGSVLLALMAGTGCKPVARADERDAMTRPVAAQGTSVDPGSPYLFSYTDFRESATKMPSLADAEKALGAEVRAPSETLGAKLLQVYLVTSDSKEQPWDQAVVLDYGEFTVGFDMCGSSVSAQTRVDERCDPAAVAAGLARRVDVGGRSGSVMVRGTSEIVLDPTGKTVRQGVTHRGSNVSWSVGRILVSVSSSTISDDQLLLVARSVDYE